MSYNKVQSNQLSWYLQSHEHASNFSFEVIKTFALTVISVKARMDSDPRAGQE